MNDLAEQALRGLAAARRLLRRHAVVVLGTLGFGVSTLVVLAGARTGNGRETRPITSWLHTQIVHGVPAASHVPGTLLFGGLAALVVLWVGTVGFVHRTAPPARAVGRLAVAWAAPFALGPPLFDTSVYRYVANGRMQRYGHDPYIASPARLGDSAIVNAIDPGQRGTPSSDGPLGSLLAHLSISVAGGTALGAVLVLRVICVLGALVACRSIAELAGDQRATAVALSAANPLLLMYAVSAAHLDVVMLAFVTTAALAARRRRWLAAVVFAALGGCVTGPGLVAVPVVIVAHVRSRRGRHRAWRALGRDVLAAAVVIGLLGVVQPDGFGWLRTVHKQFGQQTPYAVTSLTQRLLGLIVRAASYDDLAAGARLTAAIAAVSVVGYLAGTAHRRRVDTSIGGALLALALLAPELHPWYLMWGTLALVPGASTTRRRWLLALSAGGCALDPAGFGDRTGVVLTGVALLVIAGALALPATRARLGASDAAGAALRRAGALIARVRRALSAPVAPPEPRDRAPS